MSFCTLIWINLKGAKSAYGPRLAFLDLEGPSPCLENQTHLRASHIWGKGADRGNLFRSTLKAGRIDALDLEILTGRLSILQTSLLPNLSCALEYFHRPKVVFRTDSYRPKSSPKKVYARNSDSPSFSLCRVLSAPGDSAFPGNYKFRIDLPPKG